MADLTDSTVSPTVAESRAPRSATSVAAILGTLIALPLLIVVLVLVLRGSGSSVAKDAVEGVRDGRIQSVELTNGRVLFGRLEESSGGWLLLRDAYFLRRSAGSPSAKPGEKSAGTQLVPIAAEQGGDGTVAINAAEVVSFQNLAKSSDIGSQIEDATH